MLSRFQRSVFPRFMLRQLTSQRFFCSTRPHFTDLELTNLELQPNPLRDLIAQQIRTLGGYMKFSRYWSQCLTHPEHGYYSARNAFSTKGDFTTSPEISPLFGEMIATWMLHFIQTKLAPKSKKATLNSNKTLNMVPFRILELGPGRGLLMSDILRVFNMYKCLPFIHSIHFIETSELNSKEQQDKVLDGFRKGDLHFRYSYQLQGKEVFVGENSQTQLGWFKTLEDFMNFELEKKTLEKIPTIVISNELFDALPVTPLVFHNNNWHQKVITLSQSNELELSLSPAPVPAKMAPTSTPPENTTLQIGYDSLMLMESLSRIVEKNDGAILTFDYGNDFSHSDSIRAIRQHKYIDFPKWLNLPGLCDLSSYVDFSALKMYAEKASNMVACETLTQGYFLEAMGINTRVDILSKAMTKENKERLESEADRLTNPDEMGEIYKVQLVTRVQNAEVYPFADEEKKENVF